MLLAVLAALLWDVIVDRLVLFRFRLLDGRRVDDSADGQFNGDAGVFVYFAFFLIVVLRVVFLGRTPWRDARRVGFGGRRIPLDNAASVDSVLRGRWRRRRRA